jgi:hypothetical protein
MYYLLQTRYITITRVPGFDVVHFKRLSETNPDLEVFRAVMESVVATMGALDRSDLGLLIDVRDSPLRNDPAFERLLAQYRARFMSGFAKVAVLARTQVGKLQINRLAREDGIDLKIFDNEAEAMSYLTGSQPKPR